MNQDKNMYQDENKYKIKCKCAKCASVGGWKCASVHDQRAKGVAFWICSRLACLLDQPPLVMLHSQRGEILP